jgi:uncharacterized membrane protein YgcG
MLESRPLLRCTIKRHAAILRERPTMTSEMTAFAIAVGGTSLVCYLLMTRMQNRGANRNAPRDGFLPDGGNYTVAEGWIISSRFGGDNPAFDNSGNPSDSAGGDSGGGADGGGGGGGDGGGGGAGD